MLYKGSRIALHGGALFFRLHAGCGHLLFGIFTWGVDIHLKQEYSEQIYKPDGHPISTVFASKMDISEGSNIPNRYPGCISQMKVANIAGLPTHEKH